MDAKILRDKFRGCLVGAADGDALGMPVETMSRDQILKATGGGIKGMIAPIQRKIKDTRDAPAGTTTDDTLLMLCVAFSLIDRGKFDKMDQAHCLIAACCTSNLNFGLSTRTGADEIGRWFTTGGKQGRHPEAPARVPEHDGQGCGNGVAMKIESLALHHAVRYGIEGIDPLLGDVMALGLMTHGDPRASFAAYAMAVIIGKVLTGETATEAMYDQVVERVLVAEGRYRWYRPSDDTFSGALILAKKYLGSADELREIIGTEGSVMESVTFSIATFFRHPAAFRAGVLEAVNAGGDTDTTASMVGGMIGANVGLSGIPADLTNGLIGLRRLVRVADELADAVGIPKE